MIGLFGATGNVGKELIALLCKENIPFILGTKNITKTKKEFECYGSKIDFVTCNFENKQTYEIALQRVSTVFLLRPPQLANVDFIFKPFLDAIYKKGIKNIVFLSVQGADKNRYIPHAKIERLIIEKKLNYIFLRPSYFMQNLTTTLLQDIKNREIVLPAGHARFNWIDVHNIAEIACVVLQYFEEYKNQALAITGSENINFYEIVERINNIIHSELKYKNVSLFYFYKYKSKQGVPKAMIFVMMMLHFLPRFQKEPTISSIYEEIIGKKPTSFDEFVHRELQNR